MHADANSLFLAVVFSCGLFVAAVQLFRSFKAWKAGK